ncbi:MAG TPA: ammonium transporter [Prolixibacteraceae bacterium]|nr:ammonium transporter [Prolixibacteraceae bacterium]
MYDKGLTAFMVIATSLVMLMTPGLSFFYGGLGNKKNILSIMMQSFVSLALTTVIWISFGYSMCFSGNMADGKDFFGIIGNFDKAFLHGVTAYTPFSAEKNFPEFIFIAYQMMFAIITPALITGAFINRVTFKAYVIFLILWQVFVYYPFVHMVWGGGLLANWGVLDFAGGIPVHATAGFAALASVYFVGKRIEKGEGPNNIPLVAIGTALLWFGWYGFNAGSELDVDAITAQSFLNTDVAASFASVTWLLIEWNTGKKKPTFIGLMTGSVAGLATITPAAGYVSLGSAIIIGIMAGIVCYLAVKFVTRKEWDDALDVWGVHGVGGVLGTILLGFFASKNVNPHGADGLLYGGGFSFLLKQLVAIVFAASWAFIFTVLMLKGINKFVPVKVRRIDERKGLDISFHGEVARR